MYFVEGCFQSSFFSLDSLAYGGVSGRYVNYLFISQSIFILSHTCEST